MFYLLEYAIGLGFYNICALEFMNREASMEKSLYRASLNHRSQCRYVPEVMTLLLMGTEFDSIDVVIQGIYNDEAQNSEVWLK